MKKQKPKELKTNSPEKALDIFQKIIKASVTDVDKPKKKGIKKGRHKGDL